MDLNNTRMQVAVLFEEPVLFTEGFIAKTDIPTGFSVMYMTEEPDTGLKATVGPNPHMVNFGGTILTLGAPYKDDVPIACEIDTVLELREDYVKDMEIVDETGAEHPEFVYDAESGKWLQQYWGNTDFEFTELDDKSELTPAEFLATVGKD